MILVHIRVPSLQLTPCHRGKGHLRRGKGTSEGPRALWSGGRRIRIAEKNSAGIPNPH